MRAIVSGLLFDSEKANRVFSWGKEQGSFGSELYVTRKENWFLVSEAGTRERGIVRKAVATPTSVPAVGGRGEPDLTVTMINAEQAKNLLIKHGAPVDVILQYGGEQIEEA